MKSLLELEKIFKADLGGRGLGQADTGDDFSKAVDELIDSNNVLILTGFCIKDGMIGETDGPLGAVSLAVALEKLGKKVVLVTDEYSSELLLACKKVLGFATKIETVPYQDSNDFCKKLIFNIKPSHLVAIERPGKAHDGKYYNMRGEDLSQIIPDTDVLFDFAKELGIKTIAVGDGGNELGMGKLKNFIKQNVFKGEQICATKAADYLIVAGVSNWGGYGLTAGLSIKTSKRLLNDTKTEVKLLQAIVGVGAIDGCSKLRELTVDGLSLEINLEILEKLREVMEVNILKKVL